MENRRGQASNYFKICVPSGTLDTFMLPFSKYMSEDHFLPVVLPKVSKTGQSEPTTVRHVDASHVHMDQTSRHVNLRIPNKIQALQRVRSRLSSLSTVTATKALASVQRRLHNNSVVARSLRYAVSPSQSVMSYYKQVAKSVALVHELSYVGYAPGHFPMPRILRSPQRCYLLKRALTFESVLTQSRKLGKIAAGFHMKIIKPAPRFPFVVPLLLSPPCFPSFFLKFPSCTALNSIV